MTHERHPIVTPADEEAPQAPPAPQLASRSASCSALLVVLFYVLTIVKMGPGIFIGRDL